MHCEPALCASNMCQVASVLVIEEVVISTAAGELGMQQSVPEYLQQLRAPGQWRFSAERSLIDMARCNAVLCWVQTLFCAVLAGVCGERMAGLLVRMTMKQCLCVHFARRTPIRHHMHYMLLKVNWHSKYSRPARLDPRCPELLHSSDVWLHRRQQQGWRPSSSCGHMAPAFEQVSLALLLGPQAKCRACTAAAQTSSTGGSLS